MGCFEQNSRAEKFLRSKYHLKYGDCQAYQFYHPLVSGSNLSSVMFVWFCSRLAELITNTLHIVMKWKITEEKGICGCPLLRKEGDDHN